MTILSKFSKFNQVNMKKHTDATCPYREITSEPASPLPGSESQLTIQSLASLPIKEEQDLVKYIQEDADLEWHLTEAGDKLVLIAFLLLGGHLGDNLLKNLMTKAKKYQNSVVFLAVDVAKLGELAKQYNATQIPWFTFMKNNKVLEGYHSIHTGIIGTKIQQYLGLEQVNTLRTYIRDSDDLERRLTEADKKLVILAFLIPDDEAGMRLNMELDEIEEREEEIEIIKVDVDLCQEVTSAYHIQGVPTLVFLKNRITIDQFMGNDTERIHRAIIEHKSTEANRITEKIHESYKPTTTFRKTIADRKRQTFFRDEN